ncbi:hypothetical protein EYZ11_002928 [Aspergillus tanneri]|uniref:Uncharacterized protein n=1 Tax=Aspergillus tanneri TaxID=1220188 RepID=A0A4S3JPG7_9EURO|nr:hypothetical protein EYZ11_002928 [Aspergillus tanneri]
MKTIALLTTLPIIAQALVGIDWSVTNAPSVGLKDISFPMNIANAPHEEGYYFAQQFGFHGVSDVGYTGLQPRPDSNGRSIIHAVFSSFIDGTTTTDSNCHDGADGGSGVSCSIEIPAPYGHAYNLVVKNTLGTTWTGTLVDASNKESYHIGTYSLPAGTGGIKDKQVGFIEYYPWNGQPSHTCGSLPWTDVAFGNPTTTAQGVSAKVGKPYEYGDCVGKVNFKVQEINGWYDAAVGF